MSATPKLDAVRFSPTCCGWHGSYAEAPLAAGGVARIKRDMAGALTVMRFSASNACLDTQNGEPAYVQMEPEQVEALLR